MFDTSVFHLDLVKLNEVVAIHDYFQISFENKMGMNLYNPLKVEFNSQEVSIFSLVGHVVESLSLEEGEEFIINFDSGYRLWMDLRDEAYTTPEALNITFGRHWWVF